MKKIIAAIFLSLILLQGCKPSPNRDEAMLLSNPIHQASCVSFSSDENNEPVISWCETDTLNNTEWLFSYFDKTSNHFANRLYIPIEKNANLHAEGMPKIAIKKDGSILAIYETKSPTTENKFAGAIKYVQSFDKGLSWTNPLYLHADTVNGKSRSFASLTRLSDGEIAVCWLDASLGKKGGRPLKFARTNGKYGFADEKIIDSLACPCCRTAISSDNKGHITVMFRDILSDSIRDMSVINSADNGKTFAKAVSFTNDGWVINGCPHNGPSVVNEGGNSFASWFTGGSRTGVYYAALNPDGKVTERKKISGRARNIQLCLLPGDIKIVAYNVGIKVADSFYSKIAVSKIQQGQVFSKDITNNKSQATLPVLHSLGNEQVVVAFTDNGVVKYSIINAGEINVAATPEKEEPIAIQAPIPSVILSLKRDPVCGMPVKNGAAETTQHKGQTIGFCSKECKEIFIKNPVRFLAL